MMSNDFGALFAPPVETTANPHANDFGVDGFGTVDDAVILTADRPSDNVVPDVVPECYVHLCNGDVRRVKADRLPTPAGHDAPFGYMSDGTYQYLVIGVYPVEIRIGK